MLRSIYLLSFFLLQSLFAFAGNVKESVPSTFDLYVCIGQSNMAGRATLTPCNFTPVERPDYMCGVPRKKQYRLSNNL